MILLPFVMCNSQISCKYLPCYQQYGGELFYLNGLPENSRRSNFMVFIWVKRMTKYASQIVKVANSTNYNGVDDESMNYINVRASYHRIWGKDVRNRCKL